MGFKDHRKTSFAAYPFDAAEPVVKLAGMSALIRSPASIRGAFLKGSGWMAVAVGMPVAFPAEIMIFKAARSSAEFWREQGFLVLALLVLLTVAGATMAIRAAIYKMAYDTVR